MSKYTKGHWKIDQLSIKTNEINIYAKGTPLIAKVFLRDVSVNEQIANANLIAAAPELLEALIFARKMMIANDLLPSNMPHTFEKIDAIIAKAKGEAND